MITHRKEHQTASRVGAIHENRPGNQPLFGYQTAHRWLKSVIMRLLIWHLYCEPGEKRMRFHSILHVSPLVLCASIFWTASASVAGEITRGERLDPSTHGPGIVESMADALARDRLARQPAPIDPFARDGQRGQWVVPSRRSTYFPHAGDHNVVNKFGRIQALEPYRGRHSGPNR